MTQPTAYLLRYGELSLKKRNRDRFVDDLVKILKPRIKPLGGQIEVMHKKLVIRTEAPVEEVKAALGTVYGLNGISPIWRISHDFEEIVAMAKQLLAPHSGLGKSFAIRAKRPNKRYPMTSMDLQVKLANRLYDEGLSFTVNLKNPDVALGLSVEMKDTWLYLETWKGLGGLPVCGRVKYGLLLSGGIDSPVAGSRIQKRGGYLEPIYFHTPPFTVEAARDKVIDLATVLARYQNGMRLHIVNFTEIMKTLRVDCQEKYAVILSRRFMMRVALKLMEKSEGKALITGESLGQVASQTIENITAINEGVHLPILRPLIGMDKLEIIALAKQIGTFDISIRPFDDCCTLFSPKEPETRANLEAVHRQEARLGDIEGMVLAALEGTETLDI